jgi:hypothetical protein
MPADRAGMVQVGTDCGKIVAGAAGAGVSSKSGVP